MKKILFFLLFVFSVSIFPVYSHAAFESTKLEDALPPSAKEIMGDMKAENASAEGITGRIGNYLKSNVKKEISRAVKPVCAILGAALLCSLTEGLQIKREFDYVNLTACLLVALASFADVNSIASLGGRAIREIHEFSLVLLPILSSAAAASGAVSSSAAKYAATALFSDFLISSAEKFVLPIIGAYSAAILASAAIGDSRLKALIKFMKWISKKALVCLVSIFTLYLSVSGIAASGADAAAVKTAKALIGTFVPVVGKMVAGASESIAAGAGIIRNSIGIFGLCGVIALCAAPFLAIGIRFLLFKAAAVLVSMIAGERLSSLVEGIGQVYGLLLGLVGTSAVFMFISVLSLIRTVV